MEFELEITYDNQLHRHTEYRYGYWFPIVALHILTILFSDSLCVVIFIYVLFREI